MENLTEKPLYEVPIDKMVDVAKKKIQKYITSSVKNSCAYVVYNRSLSEFKYSQDYINLSFAAELEENLDERVKLYACFSKNAKNLNLNTNELRHSLGCIEGIKLDEQKMSHEDYLKFLVDEKIIKPNSVSIIREHLQNIYITDPQQVEIAKSCFQKIQDWIKKHKKNLDKLSNPFLVKRLQDLVKTLSSGNFNYDVDTKIVIDYLNENIESIKSISATAYAELKSILDSFKQDLSQPARTTGPKEPERD